MEKNRPYIEKEISLAFPCSTGRASNLKKEKCKESPHYLINSDAHISVPIHKGVYKPLGNSFKTQLSSQYDIPDLWNKSVQLQPLLVQENHNYY